MTQTPSAGLAENVFYNLGPKTFWYLLSSKATPGVVFLLLALVLSYARAQAIVPPQLSGVTRGMSWVVLAFAVIALLAAFITTKLSYRSYGFTLTPDAIKIRRGVFTSEEFAIPYRQIQNIEIERTLGQRAVGLSRVIILTAAEEDADNAKDDPEGVLPSVDREVASALQDELLRRANVQKTIEVGKPA